MWAVGQAVQVTLQDDRRMGTLQRILQQRQANKPPASSGAGAGSQGGSKGDPKVPAATSSSQPPPPPSAPPPSSLATAAAMKARQQAQAQPSQVSAAGAAVASTEQAAAPDNSPVSELEVAAVGKHVQSCLKIAAALSQGELVCVRRRAYEADAGPASRRTGHSVGLCSRRRVQTTAAAGAV